MSCAHRPSLQVYRGGVFSLICDFVNEKYSVWMPQGVA
jgi:hypothetical protein